HSRHSTFHPSTRTTSPLSLHAALPLSDRASPPAPPRVQAPAVPRPGPARVDAELSDAGCRKLAESGQIERAVACFEVLGRGDGVDRKSTRLNSSHVKISYAGVCLEKNR